MNSQPKRILITASRAGIGLSSIVKGLLVSLKESGVSIKADILGDSLLEATHIRRTTGRICQSLAPNYLTKEQILYGYGLSLSSCDLHILICPDYKFITDNPNLFAQIDPVVIFIFDEESDISDDFAVIRELAWKLNRYEKIGLVGNFSDLDYSKYESLVASNSYKFLGLIPRFEKGKFAGSSSLSVNRNPSLLTRNQTLRLKSLVETYFKFTEFRELYRQSRDVDFIHEKVLKKSVCRIAVADDPAFHLTFQDNLNLLKENGAELKLFSPLAEPSLPEGIDAIYFPNSYFDIYADEINQNKKLISQIRDRIYSGVLAYFEGFSAAYAFSKVIFENGDTLPMLEVINTGVSYFAAEPNLVKKSCCAKFVAELESLITKGGEECFGLYSEQLRLDLELKPVFSLPELTNYNLASAGVVTLSNVFCTSSIIHWGSNPALAANFVARAREVGQSDLSKASLKSDGLVK